MSSLLDWCAMSKVDTESHGHQLRSLGLISPILEQASPCGLVHPKLGLHFTPHGLTSCQENQETVLLNPTVTAVLILEPRLPSFHYLCAISFCFFFVCLFSFLSGKPDLFYGSSSHLQHLNSISQNPVL